MLHVNESRGATCAASAEAGIVVALSRSSFERADPQQRLADRLAPLDGAMGGRSVRNGNDWPITARRPAARREVERFTQCSAELLGCWPQTAHQHDPASARGCFIDIRKGTAGHAEGTEASGLVAPG